MFNRRTLMLAAALLAGAVGLAAIPLQSNAATGGVRLQLTKAGFIVGVGGGSGTLTLGGKPYPLSIGGVSVGTFGASSADLIGTARNINQPSDIEGTYTAVSAGVAVAGGGKTARLKNSKGVILELKGRQVGLELSIDLSGMTVSLR